MSGDGREWSAWQFIGIVEEGADDTTRHFCRLRPAINSETHPSTIFAVNAKGSTVLVLPVRIGHLGRLAACCILHSIKEAIDAAGNPSKWLAHLGCADSVPETWVDRVAGGENEQGQDVKCNTCGLKGRSAPIQCGRGKCPKGFHVPCAKNWQNGVGWRVTGTTENEVVMRDETGGKDEILKVIRKTDVEILCAQHNPRIFSWETVVGIVGREAPPKKHVLSAREKAELVAHAVGASGPWGSSTGYWNGLSAPYGGASHHASRTTPYGAAAAYGAYSFGGGRHAASYGGQHLYQSTSSPTEQQPAPSFERVVPQRSDAAATT
ncbi:hypothetical protein CYLTODRAFT_453769 [Cylindrobasidium torrendii FP15055 ss-10]|uniref:Uncharacterized protein n=1 Tax=Cylindrobasidium torrendii FP15055 ss-10 TaxID=1314674 RepID=A0A0D7BDB0_9AGAR|nr:hypothetical protein CYLTODRAFT_453769 [Cylindrobasidium torrendii FP15055 ss-10]